MDTKDNVVLEALESALRVMSAQQAGVAPTDMDLKASILACRMAREIQLGRIERAKMMEDIKEKMRVEHPPQRYDALRHPHEHSTYWGRP